MATPVPLELEYRDHLLIMSGLARLAEQDTEGPWQGVHDRMLEAAFKVGDAPEPTGLYTVYMRRIGGAANKKIQAIKEVRYFGNMGLKEAKDFVDMLDSAWRTCPEFQHRTQNEAEGFDVSIRRGADSYEVMLNEEQA